MSSKQRFRFHVLSVLAVLSASSVLSMPAEAQLPGVARQALGFFNLGGYFFTSGSADTALGTPKFFSEGGFYSRDKNIGNLAIAGGFETMSASDHFLPFVGGGNQFNLFGGSVRLSTPRQQGKVRPYVTFGLFAARIRSESLNYDRLAFAPSGSVGLEYVISRDFSLVANYRITQKVQGVNTDGFAISLRVR